MRLGFVGMGIMGSPMALHLCRAGYEVTVWNRTPGKTDPARAAGARVATNLTELARECEVIFICVADTADVEAVLFGDGGLAAGLGPGKIVVDHSTISPEATEGFARQVGELKAAYLDAPVSGGEAGAVQATLTIMVGGREEVLQKVRPYLEVMGKKIVYCGPQGHGQRVKAVNQVICALNILACSEGLLFAQQMGLEMQTVLDVVSSGAAGSWMLSNLGPKIIADDFAPGFMIRLQAKDLGIAAASMSSLPAAYPGTDLTNRLFTEAVAQSLGEEGTQGLVNLLGWQKSHPEADYGN